MIIFLCARDGTMSELPRTKTKTSLNKKEGFQKEFQNGGDLSIPVLWLFPHFLHYPRYLRTFHRRCPRFLPTPQIPRGIAPSA